MRTVYNYFLAFRYRWNGFLTTLFLRSLGCTVGSGLKCLRIPIFKDMPKKNISIGSGVSMGVNVVFEIPPVGQLKIGDKVTVGDFNRFSTIDKIEIGDWVAIGEHVSIRGSFHNTNKGIEIVKQGDSGEPIHIGRDVLLGAYTVVLQGAAIPDGAIIGAKSLVKKSDHLHKDGIFAGSPLKHLRDR